MYNCIKCNKEFKFESELLRHKNRKTNCDKNKEELKCKICNVNFVRPSHKKNHEKTKKHIYNVSINGDNNINVIGNNNLNKIINLTLNTNTFSNSNVGLVANLSIEIVYGIFDNIINNKNSDTLNNTIILFNDAIIPILDTLHFNISNSENHNLKILLMFPKIDKMVYEYLILEINKETNELVWNSIDYFQLLEEIFNLLHNINSKNIERHNNIKNEKNNKFDEFINYLKFNLLINEENKTILKPKIESVLNDLYIQFNKNQNKPDREIKLNILEKINEYKNYRNNECRLSNGHTPQIINSQI